MHASSAPRAHHELEDRRSDAAIATFTATGLGRGSEGRPPSLPIFPMNRSKPGSPPGAQATPGSTRSCAKEPRQRRRCGVSP